MTKGEYALLWANGASFSEIYDLMEADIYKQWLAIDADEEDED